MRHLPDRGQDSISDVFGGNAPFSPLGPIAQACRGLWYRDPGMGRRSRPEPQREETCHAAGW